MAASKELFTTLASIAASAVLVRSIVNELLPYELRDYISSSLEDLRARLSSQLTVIIQETEGYSQNHLYEASKTYLSTKISPSTRRLSARKFAIDNCIEVSIERGQEVMDVFNGIQFKWQLICREITRPSSPDDHQYNTPREARSLELSFHKKHKETAMGAYLPYVLEQAKTMVDENKTLKIHTNDGDCWSDVNLHHPSTFETLAMESELKKAVMEDLERFVKRKEYYKRVGKVWKRGYLLYGPPGTGKSSLIAAMANYLKFNIYDLELTEISNNSTLRRMLIGTANRSILVVEDIDCCSLDLQYREEEEEEDKGSDHKKSCQKDKVTLSGLLNFVDGLWSSCGEERIIVFTTNYKERLDPALLRPGRMDMHVYMGYCSPCAFRVLASNYHAVLEDHRVFSEIEEMLGNVDVTPAEVAEELMKSDDADVAFQGLLQFLQVKHQSHHVMDNVVI